ncbi:MAG: hypothetical protein ACI8UG_000619 [Gammaproteobacteria bacterium]|jgi:hypothetical protein
MFLFVITLFNAGLYSVFQIAALTLTQFRTNVGDLSENITDTVYTNALQRSVFLNLLYMDSHVRQNSLFLSTITQGESSYFNAKNQASYENIFDSTAYHTVPDDRSFVSQSAYLVSLRELVDRFLNTTDVEIDYHLTTRRPDIEQISLDQDNTFTLKPRLAIINRLLQSAALPNNTAGQTRPNRLEALPRWRICRR